MTFLFPLANRRLFIALRLTEIPMDPSLHSSVLFTICQQSEPEQQLHVMC